MVLQLMFGELAALLPNYGSERRYYKLDKFEIRVINLLFKGNTEQEQLVRISKLCGSINPDNWPGCEQLPLYGKLKPEFQQINGHNSAIPQNFPRRVRERIGPFLQVVNILE
jgi:hypothetical protein